MTTWTDDELCKRIESVGADLGMQWKCRRGHTEPDEGEDFEPFDFYQARTRKSDKTYIIDFDECIAEMPWDAARAMVEFEMDAA